MKKSLYTILALIALFLSACSSDGTDTATANELSGNDSGLSGSLARFTILNDYLYTVDDFRLNVFNISNPENPVQVNSISIGFAIETLYAYKTYLYIGSRNGMFIYDAGDQENPQYLSSAQHFTACDPVIANDTHAFITLKGGNQCGMDLNVLEVYNVEDVTNPILITQRNMSGPVGMAFYQDYLFVCDDEVKIFDISDPNNLNLIHSINRESFDVIIQPVENLMILIGANGVYQYQLDPDNIQNETLLSTLGL